jgi:TRAP-type C4-dicarboxylate transport system permease small subunit
MDDMTSAVQTFDYELLADAAYYAGTAVSALPLGKVTVFVLTALFLSAFLSLVRNPGLGLTRSRTFKTWTLVAIHLSLCYPKLAEPRPFSIAHGILVLFLVTCGLTWWKAWKVALRVASQWSDIVAVAICITPTRRLTYLSTPLFEVCAIIHALLAERAALIVARTEKGAKRKNSFDTLALLVPVAAMKLLSLLPIWTGFVLYSLAIAFRHFKRRKRGKDSHSAGPPCVSVFKLRDDTRHMLLSTFP